MQVSHHTPKFSMLFSSTGLEKLGSGLNPESSHLLILALASVLHDIACFSLYPNDLV